MICINIKSIKIKRFTVSFYWYCIGRPTNTFCLFPTLSVCIFHASVRHHRDTSSRMAVARLQRNALTRVNL